MLDLHHWNATEHIRRVACERPAVREGEVWNRAASAWLTPAQGSERRDRHHKTGRAPCRGATPWIGERRATQRNCAMTGESAPPCDAERFVGPGFLNDLIEARARLTDCGAFETGRAVPRSRPWWTTRVRASRACRCVWSTTRRRWQLALTHRLHDQPPDFVAARFGGAVEQ